MLNIRKENVVEVSDWDALVVKTYGRPYSFQQQDGCKSRGIFRFSVPDDEKCEDFENDTVEEKVNGKEMGVSFKAWLERDPKKKLKGDRSSSSLELWWDRNFYPNFQMVANDLHSKGLLDAGEYTIDIDW